MILVASNNLDKRIRILVACIGVISKDLRCSRFTCITRNCEQLAYQLVCCKPTLCGEDAAWQGSEVQDLRGVAGHIPRGGIACRRHAHSFNGFGAVEEA